MRKHALAGLAVLLLVAVAAGCGGGGSSASTPVGAMNALLKTAHPELVGGTVTQLFADPEWAVVVAQNGNNVYAAAFRLVGKNWVADTSNKVKIKILGPQPGATVLPTVPPQVGIDATSETKQPLDTGQGALWLDGVEVDNGGGGGPHEYSYFSTPTTPAPPGIHVAVGFARTDTSATAVAWTFQVKDRLNP